MTVASPTPFQMSTRAMEKIARLGLVSQSDRYADGCQRLVDEPALAGSSRR